MSFGMTNNLELQALPENSRADLARRNEVKFTIPHTSIDVVRDAIRTRCLGISYNEYISTVRSVYFDDSRLSCLRANVDGLAKRTKVRMRWYDSIRPKHELYFEMKWRQNRVTGKHRTLIRSATPLEATPYRELVAGIMEQLPDEQRPLLMRYDVPTMLVEYHRQHFRSPDGHVRLTLDYNIVGYDQVGRKSIHTSFGQSLEGLVVVEGKTGVGEQYRIRELLQPIKTRAGRCSKYVQCCQLFGYAHD